MNRDRSEDDALWHKDANDHGYSLPAKASAVFRVWGIRHVRALYLTWRVERQASAYASIGIGFGGANPYDYWVLYAITRGWC